METTRGTITREFFDLSEEVTKIFTLLNLEDKIENVEQIVYRYKKQAHAIASSVLGKEAVKILLSSYETDDPWKEIIVNSAIDYIRDDGTRRIDINTATVLLEEIIDLLPREHKDKVYAQLKDNLIEMYHRVNQSILG